MYRLAAAASTCRWVSADRLLRERGAVLAPDILTNAGGVIVSCFEWRENLHYETWTLETVNQRLVRGVSQ